MEKGNREGEEGRKGTKEMKKKKEGSLTLILTIMALIGISKTLSYSSLTTSRSVGTDTR